MDIALDPIEIESRRRERTWRLAAIELPLVRLGGSILLCAGVYINNRFLVPGTPCHAKPAALVRRGTNGRGERLPASR